METSSNMYSDEEVIEFSRFGQDLFECHGTCYCDSEILQDERRVSNVIKFEVIKRSVFLLIAAITSVSASKIALERFQTKCQNEFEEDCPSSYIQSEVDSCEVTQNDEGLEGWERITEKDLADIAEEEVIYSNLDWYAWEINIEPLLCEITCQCLQRRGDKSEKVSINIPFFGEKRELDTEYHDYIKGFKRIKLAAVCVKGCSKYGYDDFHSFDAKSLDCTDVEFVSLTGQKRGGHRCGNRYLCALRSVICSDGTEMIKTFREGTRHDFPTCKCCENFDSSWLSADEYAKYCTKFCGEGDDCSIAFDYCMQY